MIDKFDNLLCVEPPNIVIKFLFRRLSSLILQKKMQMCVEKTSFKRKKDWKDGHVCSSLFEPNKM